MIDFGVVDIVDIVDFVVVFVWIIENLWKRVDIYFSYSKYIILRIIAERDFIVLREILIIIIII